MQASQFTDEQVDAAIREWMGDDDRTADGFRRRMRAALSAAHEAPAINASTAFSKWLEDGPRLAKAAGVYVGIKVTDAQPIAFRATGEAR